jgi:UDP-N-acetylmuramoylalanine--D-glutamate ligase
MENSELVGELYAVIGLARAGLPAARFLAERGGRVIGYDDRELDELGLDAKRLRGLGVELKTGDHGFADIDKCQTIVLSPGLKIHHEPIKSIIAEAEARGAEVIGELELAYRHCPAPIIAVTGTKGKSTTAKLIAEMLRACEVDVVLAGNTGTPLVAELSHLKEDSWAVVEVSSFQLEKAPTFKPKIAVLLNLLPDHQDYHPSLLQYWNTKLKIFANQTEDDVAIFNVDDAAVADLAHGQGDFLGWRDSLKSRVMMASARVAPRAAESRKMIQQEWIGWDKGEEWIPVVPLDAVPLRGAHNLSNMAAALAALGASVAENVVPHRLDVVEAVKNFESLPHRLEVVGQGALTWVNDSQATIPAAAIAALNAFPGPIALIAGGLAKLDAPAYEPLGQAIMRKAQFLITIGQSSDLIAGAALSAGFSAQKIIDAHTLEQAVKAAKEVLPPGGTVLLSPACASFDQFRSYEHRGEIFKALVMNLEP